MDEIKTVLQIVLKAFRYYDDENDLARFDNFMEAGIAAMEASGSCYHADILKALFKEALNDGKGLSV